ncbi:MAG: ribbon-helix-helix domain-containing protein [Candidatus Hodarchaeales archaeon]|jgi:Arc/MetJ-type ribon-helix-helix transcriptional regulator
MAKRKNISFKTSYRHIQLLDELVNRGIFSSRGEVIRVALKDYLKSWTKVNKKENLFKNTKFTNLELIEKIFGISKKREN